jgi:hypothetical protein
MMAAATMTTMGEDPELHRRRYFSAPPVIPRTNVSMNRL